MAYLFEMVIFYGELLNNQMETTFHHIPQRFPQRFRQIIDKPPNSGNIAKPSPFTWRIFPTTVASGFPVFFSRSLHETPTRETKGAWGGAFFRVRTSRSRWSAWRFLERKLLQELQGIYHLVI